jgi:predicted nuclease with TOPRIM domain
VQQGDGHLRAGKKLSKRYDTLKSERDALAGDKKDLEEENALLMDALDTAAEDVMDKEEKAAELEDDNRTAKHRVSNLEQQVANYQTAEAADITQGLLGFGMSAE